MNKPSARPGTIGWVDLTGPNAGTLKDFYATVVGWQAESVPVDGHQDYAVGPPGADPVAGICHDLPPNQGLPAQWLIYIHVLDLDAAVRACLDHGGEVLRPAQSEQAPRFAVIRDPVGAVCALYQADPLQTQQAGDTT